jgi:hypothetical protein
MDRLQDYFLALPRTEFLLKSFEEAKNLCGLPKFFLFFFSLFYLCFSTTFNANGTSLPKQSAPGLHRLYLDDDRLFHLLIHGLYLVHDHVHANSLAEELHCRPLEKLCRLTAA